MTAGKKETKERPKTTYHVLRENITGLWEEMAVQEAHNSEAAVKATFPTGSDGYRVVAVADSSWRPGVLAAKVPPPVLSFNPADAPVVSTAPELAPAEV